MEKINYNKGKIIFHLIFLLTIIFMPLFVVIKKNEPIIWLPFSAIMVIISYYFTHRYFRAIKQINQGKPMIEFNHDLIISNFDNYIIKASEIECIKYDERKTGYIFIKLNKDYSNIEFKLTSFKKFILRLESFPKKSSINLQIYNAKENPRKIFENITKEMPSKSCS